ncbi:MORN repeat [Novymonas esmeraldas]|uniref:MORN repeat n=1 Tax=Novymonas esmeraldas TaxID=1808958 RepID=A0AAW0F2Q8_9TRYP
MITSNVVPVMVPVSARSHLMNMSVPLGSQSTVLDPSNPFPTDGTASARHPVSYFTVALTQPSLVVVHMKEGNTASRCALFLSCSCPKPDANNAAWRLISPEPHKQIVLHPADPAYRVGVLHIAVHYLEPSGHSHFQLQARVQPDFFAMWLRTGGEIARAGPTAAADSMNTAKSLRQFGVATVVPTLHATLAASAARPTGTAAPAAGAPFSSLYVGDWRGDQRDGLGFQYYAAPEEVSLRMTAAMEDVQDLEHEYTQTSGSGTRSLGATNTSSTFAASAAGVDVAQPLLLLRAFSERHNLPWSAWSIPDTLTPEELARLGFGFCFRSASSARAGKAAAGTSPTAVAASGRSATVVSPSRGAAAAAAVALPPTPPAAPCPTAAEGIAALGAAINSFMVSEIMGGDVEAWQVLPVRPGVEVYAGEWVANQKEGSGAYQWLDRSYVGDWVAGRREGHGLLRRQDGSWYRGQWRRHVPHGRGEARLMPDGLVHRGEWCDGRRHGAGALTYPNGMTVEGVWVDDELQARVRVVYRDGSTYDGLWDAVEACRQGQGTWTDTHGCRHMHEWDRDVCVGPGREAYPNGVVLEGVWTAGELVDGTYVFPNGDRHMGDMDASLHVRDGAGSTVSADGLAVYTGAWSGDKRSGRGTQTVQRLPKAGGDAGEAGASPAMERYEGEWRDNMRSGRGRLTDGDDVYEGEFALDCRDGVGVHRNTRTGSFYEGSWKANHRCGAGTYYCATHDTTYEGVFLHDRLTGLGTATNGTTDERYSGSWLDGLQQGHGSLRLANGDVLRGVWHRGAPGAATTVEYTEAEQFADRSCLAGAGESRYVGGWKDGVREGTGTQVFRDGSVYEGAWRANKQHGHGRRTTAAGESVACEWRDGHIVGGGTGEAHFADGSVYRGPVNVAGVPDGVGVLTYPDGTVFDGRFVDGIYQL